MRCGVLRETCPQMTVLPVLLYHDSKTLAATCEHCALKMQGCLDWVRCFVVRQLLMRLPARLVWGCAEDVRWQVQGSARADGRKWSILFKKERLRSDVDMGV